MRILFVAMPDSIHVARWISQIADQGWEIFLFSPYRAKPHPELKKITIFGTDLFPPTYKDKSLRYIRWSSFFFYRDALKKFVAHQISNQHKLQALVYAIKGVDPDIVHSLEFQHAGYLTLSAKKQIGEKFPTWITTNWGSDIFLFGRLTEHQERIQQMLQSCEYYSCECERDVRLASDMGFQGSVLPVLPNAGGMHLENVLHFRKKGPVSKRRKIVLKGYQGWAGRALVAFQAFRLCIDALQSYTISIYSAEEDVEIVAKLFMLETGISVEIIQSVSHEELLSLFGNARVYIGLSISDGISTSLLESIVMGAFPIQSCTSCADEWIEDGKSGFIVPPEEPQVIADAIRLSLTDDDLVNQAAEINLQTARERLDYSSIQAKVIKMYQDIYDLQRK